MTKRRQRTIEILLFAVIALVGFAGVRRVLTILAIEKAKAQIAQMQTKPSPFLAPAPHQPFQFGPPPFRLNPNAPDLFDLPFTPLPPVPGSPAWFKALPPVPPCNQPWDIWRSPQCQRVSNYI